VSKYLKSANKPQIALELFRKGTDLLRFTIRRFGIKFGLIVDCLYEVTVRWDGFGFLCLFAFS
jgi:hypothetical protein